MEQKSYECVCNRCGRPLRKINGILHEDALMITKDWGYFSAKDGERHSLCICEECYNKLIRELSVPVRVDEITEYC